MKARFAATLCLAMMVLLVGIAPALASGSYSNSVTYTSQGISPDGFGAWDLKTEICGVANGAPVEGPYLVWLLNGTRAKNADITGPWGTAEMTRARNGDHHYIYISGWYDPDDLLPFPVVATYDGKPKNAQLTISHGCRPFNEGGAWCSPGFWSNAQPGAWALVGYTRDSLFNDTVFAAWYGATFPANPTLGAVLDSPPTYSEPSCAGTNGYVLSASDATGAFLTNNIPGYQFDWGVMMAGGSNACPIDQLGNFK